MSVYFLMEFVRSLRSVAYFFDWEKVRRNYLRLKNKRNNYKRVALFLK
jgi:ribosomal protein L33